MIDATKQTDMPAGHVPAPPPEAGPRPPLPGSSDSHDGSGPFLGVQHRPTAAATFWHSTWVIVLVALILRLGWAILVPVHPIADSAAYDTFAQSIAAGHGYAWAPGVYTAYWPVGTAAVYAGLFALFGHSYTPAVILNIAVALATIVLAMDLARRWYDPRVAVFAGWALALWPSQIEFVTVLASELMFNLALLAALWCWSRRGRRSWRWAIAAGVALALTSYIRPTALIWPAILLVMWLPQHFSWRIRLRDAVLAGAVMVLCIAPWTLRNEVRFGALIPIATNGGPNLWMGNNPQSQGVYMPLPKSVEGMSEIDRARALRSAARSYIIAHPGAFVVRTAKKLVMLHDRETIGVVWNADGLTQRLGARVLMPLKAISTAYWYLLLLMGIGGAVVVIIRKRWVGILSPAILNWATFAGIYAVIVVQDRYHFSYIPFVAMLAGITFTALRGASVSQMPLASA